MAANFDFLSGTVRAAFMSRAEAVAAAREAVEFDEKRRPRNVWLCKGANSAGVVVPDRFVVGLAHDMPTEFGALLETVRP